MNENRKKHISIIVPTWNEEGNIARLVDRINTALFTKNITYEIIFVDDNSSDQTQANIKLLSRRFPIRMYVKQGARGKAYSLLEGFTQTKADVIAFIDADLQYPPEALPGMIKKISDGADIVVANRKKNSVSLIRKVMSDSFKNIFGKMFFGFNHDIQSGMKVFTREVFELIKFTPKTGWTFDLEFIHRASQAGFTIESYDIAFEKRHFGQSKVSFLKTSLEIGLNALSLKARKVSPLHLKPLSASTMQGAGIGYKKKKYITHTTLHHNHSAIETFLVKQKLWLMFLLLATTAAFIFKPILALQILIGILSLVYFIDVIFNLYLMIKSLRSSPEIAFDQKEFETIDENKLPVYSILCPLYKEAHILPHFLKSISKLDYPKEKLDVMLLLEEDDQESINAVATMDIPAYVRTIVVPHSFPKTKPKACNYGLVHAKGEYLVIYDAEDMPDPLQLKKAYLGFKKAGKNVICLQAKLNYYNPHQNLLTRFFTAEYSLWFDITLTGLQSINTTIPLGGTSNHFRKADLQMLEGWDPFNVTEDADLGIRLFKRGYQTAIIDSVTLEEANSNPINWIRQRSRWIKGYMQTYLVHTRELFGLKGDKKIHTLIFHLVIGGKIAFILINPFLWLATISYFTLYAIVGPTIELLYPPLVFYMAGFSLIFGNFLFLYYYMIGAIKREQWELIKYIFLIPLYWILISIAGFMALHQLLFKPHYWEKTVHGLHLLKAAKKTKELDRSKAINTQPTFRPAFNFVQTLPAEQEHKDVLKGTHRVDPIQKLTNFILSKKLYFSGSILIVSILISNFLNFLFNAYLGRVLSYETLGLVSLINSFLYLTAIPFIAITQTLIYRIGFLDERYGKDTAYKFWSGLNKRLLHISLALSVLWIGSAPFLMNYFKTENILPILLFTPIWLVGFAASANKGFLTGKLLFVSAAIITIVEPLIKLLGAIILVSLHMNEWIYITIPLSVVIGFIMSLIYMRWIKPSKMNAVDVRHAKSFPSKFFFVSLLSGLSAMVFLSLDVILAKHFLSGEEAGQYALVSLVGKMIFFISTLFTILIIPFVSRNEGAKKNSSHILYKSLAASSILAFVGFILIGVFGYISIPFLFGEKAQSIIQYLLPFTFAVGCFSLSTVFISYYLTKRIYTFPVITFLLTILQIILISLYHQNIYQIVQVMMYLGYINLLIVTFLHLGINTVTVIENNIKDFFGIFAKEANTDPEKKLRILIFNWRDTRHKWAGGAEAYVHEIAKRLVKDGNSVTVFCGNDQQSSRNQVIDNVRIVRRGGFYTVYFWAFVYYILKFRGKYDIIVDSENGIPFLTPLFVKKPICLLIHHVHQEVFREHLSFPLAIIASFIEGKLMPFLYKNQTIITVSESSKQEILKLGFTDKNGIHVIHPGIASKLYFKTKKAINPTFIYLGRLKPYKNVDILVKAFGKVLQQKPLAQLHIVGDGESAREIKKLVEKLGLSNSINFFGKVTEEEKIRLLGLSWAAVQPSQIEGWGITVIEANACETPVIASNVNGLRDSIVDGQTGMLVKLKNIDQFAAAMHTIIANVNMRKNLSQEAYLWSQRFSWDKSARKFYDILTQEQLNNNRETNTFGISQITKSRGALG